MSRRKGRKPKPPRLLLRKDDRTWIILDRGRQLRTGCSEEETEGAARALEDYLGTRHKPTIGARDPAALKIVDVLDAYADIKDPGAACTDIGRRNRFGELCDRLDRLAQWWGNRSVADIKKSACDQYVDWRIVQPRRRAKSAQALAKPISRDTPRRELEDLRAAVNAYHAEHVLYAVPTVSMPEKGEGRADWLTRTMAARLLGAAIGFVWDQQKGTWKRADGRLVRRDRVTRTRRRHAARFILIGLYTARREATIRRTQWVANTTAPWFDLDAMIYHGRGSDEPKTKKRRPPAKIAYRLRPHLLRWWRLDMELSDRLRQTGATGVAAAVRHTIHRPDGRPLTGKIKTGWKGILTDAGLGPEVVRHTLRHTAATWTMQSGTDLWMASGWLGMTVEMLQEKYGHHHPDFQEAAASAFGSERRRQATMNGTRTRNDNAMNYPKRP